MHEPDDEAESERAMTEDDEGLPVRWAAHRFDGVVNAAVDA